MLSKYQVRSSQSSANKATFHPSLLLEATNAAKTIEPQVQQSLQKYNICMNSIISKGSAGQTLGTCRCRVKRRSSVKHRGWLATVSEEEYEHESHCHRSSYSDYSRSVVAQVTVYTNFIQSCVQLGWQKSRKGGWTTIIPMLRYRNIVSRDSGVFKLLYDANRAFDVPVDGEFDKFPEARRILSDVSATLPRLLTNSGRPTDVDESGNGIFEVCSCAAFAITK